MAGHSKDTSTSKTEVLQPEVVAVQEKLQEFSISETQGIRLGVCKWFNVAKGWGFITPKDGGQDVFVHQSVIQMSGFRSLGESEEVEFECKSSDKGFEATRVSGPQKSDCHGSTFRPHAKRRFRKVRCYNCGEFANHIAAKCTMGPQPKRCHHCKNEDHLVADCPVKPEKSKTRTDSNDNSISSVPGQHGVQEYDS